MCIRDRVLGVSGAGGGFRVVLHAENGARFVGDALHGIVIQVHQRQFGFTQADVELILRPMMMKGAEPLGSMGNDAPLARCV